MTDVNYIRWVQTNLVNYSDIPTVLFYDPFTMYDEISWNVPFITQLMAVFTDANLVTANIYNNKSEAYTNPILIVNSNDEGGGIAITANQTSLAIIGSSTITGNTTISTNVTLGNMYVGANATVGIVDSSAGNSNIGQLTVRAINGFIGSVVGAVYGSFISNIIVDDGATYGGYLYDNPDLTCSNPISNLIYVFPKGFENVTHNKIPLSWTAPANPYIALIIQFKESSSNVWITADNTTGNYLSATSYVLTNLKHDTFYDVQIITVCPNGGWSNPVQQKAIPTNQILPTPIG